MPIPLAQAGLAALLAAAAPAGSNPLLAPWTGPYGGVPPFDQVEVEQFEPALEAGMAEQLSAIDEDHGRDRAAHLREHDRRDGALRPRAEAGPEPLRRLELLDEHPGVPGGRARDGAPPRRVPGPDHPERDALPEDRRGLRGPGERGAHPRAESVSRGSTTTTFARTGARLDPAGKKRLSEINQRLATLYTTFAQNVLADETDHVLFLEGERDLAGPPRLAPLRRRRGRRVAREEGPVGRPQHALEHGAVPDLLGEARPSREGLADLLQPGRQRRREGQQRDDHRDPRSARRAREAPRLRDLRALEPRGHHGEDAGAGHGPHGGGLDAGRRPREGGGRRDAGDRRPRGGRDPDRALGLPLLRGEGAQGQVRPRRERGEALPPARQAPRRHVLGGRGGLRPPLLPRPGGAGVPPGRRRLRGEGRGRQARRPLVLRPLGPPRQALGGLDERLPRPGALRRRGPDHRLEQLELREGRGRRAGARELGRRLDDVPRVRPRPPRPELERRLPLALRDVRGPRLRGVPLADPRALARDAGGPLALRPPLPHRPAHAEASSRRRSSGPRPSARASTRSSTWRARSST